jgi:hypothetical protein
MGACGDGVCPAQAGSSEIVRTTQRARSSLMVRPSYQSRQTRTVHHAPVQQGSKVKANTPHLVHSPDRLVSVISPFLINICNSIHQ